MSSSFQSVILLGSTGFVGGQVAARLRNGPFLLQTLPRSQCDLLDAASIRRILLPALPHSSVIVAAGIPRLRDDGFGGFRGNAEMMYNLVRAFEEAPPKEVVFLSSVECYGTPRTLPVTEMSPCLPDTLYGVSKVTCELLLRAFHRRSGVPILILRPPGIYGPGDRGRGLVGKLIECAQSRKPFECKADSEELRDYLHVRDLSEVIARCCGRVTGEMVLNVATGMTRRIGDIIHAVKERYGALEVVSSGSPSIRVDLGFDVTALLQVIGDMRWTSIEEGVASYSQGTAASC